MPSRLEEKTLGRALNRLGRWFERQGELGEALACYSASSIPPAGERGVRTLHKMGNRAAAEAQLRLLRGNPANPQEADFAARFSLVTGRVSGCAQSANVPRSAVAAGSGRPRRTGPAETVLALTPPPDEKIERFAMRVLAEDGGEAWHLENRLPQGLAALAFWDVVFAPVAGAFLNPYQDGPLDLYWDDFAAQRRGAIAAQRSRLADPAEFGRILRTTCKAKAGVANALMSWRHIDGRLVARLLEAVPHAKLFRLACDVIENPSAARTGFPTSWCSMAAPAMNSLRSRGRGTVSGRRSVFGLATWSATAATLGCSGSNARRGPEAQPVRAATGRVGLPRRRPLRLPGRHDQGRGRRRHPATAAARRPPSYQREVAVAMDFDVDSAAYRLRGRVDGLDLAATPPVVEEFKTTRADPALVVRHDGPVHRAQAKLYAAMLAADHPAVREWLLRLLYCHPDTGRVEVFEECASTPALGAFLKEALSRFAAQVRPQRAHQAQRNAWLAQRPFPFASFRPHQRATARRCYRASVQGENLLLEAPTGSGKTSLCCMRRSRACR